MNKPAILGGEPAFEQMLNIVNPAFPAVSQIAGPLDEALLSGNVTNHSINVRMLEQEISNYLGGVNFVAVSNGTLAIQLIFERMGLKGEVICPSFSYVATAHAIACTAGLTPVFAEIDPDTWNVTAETVAPLINERTAAILPVHVFGNPCEIEGLERLANDANVKLIFDSAHAIGALYRSKKIGHFGDAETFSFHATKTLPMAEGGGITTHNEELAENLRAARVFGDYGDHDCEFASTNAKMQEFSAILGRYGLKRLDENIAQRKQCVGFYKERLSQLPGITFQRLNPLGSPSYQNFAILINEMQFGLSRDELHDALTAENIMTRKYFFPSIHQQKAYLQKKVNLTVTESVCSNVLCLPLHNHMAVSLVTRICEAIEAIHQNASNIRQNSVVQSAF